MIGIGTLKKLIMRYSPAYQQKVTTAYWAKAPKTHGSTSPERFDFYASEIDKLIQKYSPGYGKVVLDHGAGEGSIAQRLATIQNNGGGV